MSNFYSLRSALDWLNPGRSGALGRQLPRDRCRIWQAQHRIFLSQQNLYAPPGGYEVVKFRTGFANKADAIETVTLEREADA